MIHSPFLSRCYSMGAQQLGCRGVSSTKRFLSITIPSSTSFISKAPFSLKDDVSSSSSSGGVKALSSLSMHVQTPTVGNYEYNAMTNIQPPMKKQYQQQSLSLSDMIQQIPTSIRTRKQQNIPAGSTHDPTIQLIHRLNTEAIRDEVRPYCHYDPTVPYTRNLITTDHELYTLLVICWSGGQASPIHDHPCDGCYMKILSGSIFEKRFVECHTVPQASRYYAEHDDDDSDSAEATSATPLRCIAHDVYTKNQVAFINDAMGYHQIGAHDTSSSILDHSQTISSPSSTMAMSLHLYCPPIQHCTMFASSSSSSSSNNEQLQCVPRTVPMRHYSEYGRRC